MDKNPFGFLENPQSTQHEHQLGPPTTDHCRQPGRMVAVPQVRSTDSSEVKEFVGLEEIPRGKGAYYSYHNASRKTYLGRTSKGISSMNIGREMSDPNNGGHKERR